MKKRLQSAAWFVLVLAAIGGAVGIVKAIPWDRRSWAMDILAMALLLGIYLLMFDTFLAAFRGGDAVLVTVNTLGEKWGELLGLSVAGGFVLWRFGVMFFRGLR